MRRIALLILLLLWTAAPVWSQDEMVGVPPPPLAEPERAPLLSDSPLAEAPCIASPPPGSMTTLGLCFQGLFYESPYDTTYVMADLVAFRRDWQAAQNMASLNSPINGVLNTHDLEITYQPGLRMLVGRRLSDWFALEGTFLGLLHWDETRAVLNQTTNSQGTLGNLRSPLSNFGQPLQVGLDYNSLVTIRTISDFNTAEINIRQRFDTPLSLMQASGIYGLRYISINDRFEYRSTSGAPSTAGTDNAVDTAATNNLFGVQIGMTLDFRVERRAWINFEGKGLILHNSVGQDTIYTVGPNGGPGTTTAMAQSKGRAVFGGDFSGSVVWKFTPRLIGRCGYQCLFVDGLALGSDNFARNAPFIPLGHADVTLEGRLAFHGPFAGLTYTW